MEDSSSSIADEGRHSIDPFYNFKNNMTRSESPSFNEEMSPKRNNINSSGKVISDYEEDERHAIVGKEYFQNDQTSCDVDNSSSDELESDCTEDDDYAFFKEINGKNLNDILMEISQAIHHYSNKMKNLNISVEWELPEILIPKNGLKSSKGGVKGPLEPEEISFLKKRLKEFCEEYNIDDAAVRACLSGFISKICFPNELRLRFIQYLCKDYVNDRNPLTILRAVSKLGTRKGKYSQDEEKFLIDMHHNYKGSSFYAVCGLLLNRHRMLIYRKIKRLKKKDSLGPRASWSNLKTNPLKMRDLIMKNLLNRRNYDLGRLKYRLNKRSWLSIGKEYSVSPALAKAIYFCEVYPQIYAVHPVKFRRFFMKMLYTIKRSDWETWEEVKWINLSALLYNVGTVFVYVMLRKLIKHCVPKEKWNNFRDCAEYLLENVLPIFENGPKKAYLNRIVIKQELDDD